MTSHTEQNSVYQQVPLVDDEHYRPESGESFSSYDQSKEKISTTSASHEPCNWSVGWKTPLLITVLYIVAIAVAVCHYVYCHFLDNRSVKSTVRQTWNNGISVAFVRAFSMALAGSAAPAFTQLLWWFLRRKPLTLEKIDSVFSLNTSPLNLYQVGLLRTLPVLWFFGLLFPLISVSTIFPPGALVVQQLFSQNSSTADMPILDVTYRGNNTPISFFENAMFMGGPDGSYQSPKFRYSAIGKRTVLEGAYLTRPSGSVYGLNYTYSVSFPAPSFRCKDANPEPSNLSIMLSEFAKLHNSQGFNANFSPEAADFMAGSYQTNNSFLGPSSDLRFVFAVMFKRQGSDILRNVSCIPMSATYHTNITYTNGLQTVKVNVTDEQPLSATQFDPASAFYDVVESEPWSDPIHYTSELKPRPFCIHSDAELNSTFKGMQMKTIVDAAMQPLRGAVSRFGNNEGSFTGDTLIKETPFAHAVYNRTAMDYSSKYFDLSPTILEELLQNATISILNDASSIVQTKVTSFMYQPSYRFQSPPRLVIAYAAALGAFLPFIILGFAAMLSNGVSASHGGFLQIACTTTANGSLNQLARRACLGGEQDLRDELKKLEVRFGEMRDRDGSGGRFAAFGTEREICGMLRKGSAMM